VESANFLFTRRVLAFFRVNPAKSFNHPDFFIRSACVDQSSGQPRVNPGKQEGGGGAQKIKKIGEFSFQGYLAANEVKTKSGFTRVVAIVVMLVLYWLMNTATIRFFTLALKRFLDRKSLAHFLLRQLNFY